MSGPDQVQDVQAQVHRERQQSQARIKIANLLCSIEAAEPVKTEPWASPRTEAVNFEGLSPPPKVRHTDPDDNHHEYGYSKHQALTTRSSAQSSSNSIHNDSPVYVHSASVHDPRRPMEIGERRDSGLGRRDIDTADAGYSRYEQPYSSSGWDQLPRNAPRGHSSSFFTPSSASGHYTPRSTPLAQRSASFHADYYRDNCHPCDVDQQQSRTQRSNSDYALHQQNYGPYLDKSPSLPPAPLFQARPPSPRQSQHGLPNSLPPSPPRANSSTYYYDRATPPADHTRSPYQPTHAPRRSIQDDARRPSQSIILPSPESLYTSSESRKPTRIYGLDAADIPARPPLAPSASFGAKPLQDIPDEHEHEAEYSRRPSTQHADSGYRHAREPSSRFSQRPYEYQSTPSSNGGRPTYRSNNVDRPQYDYNPQDNVRPSTSTYPQNHSEYNRYSPGTDVSPPTWYQQYAHAVPHKPKPRSSMSYGDTHAYSSHNRRESDYAPSRNITLPQQQPRSPEHWSSRPSFSAGPHSANTSVGGDDRSHGTAKPMPRSSISTSHSVHPFDVPADPPASPPSITGKRDRGQEEDPFVSEDGVKAKRKRANAEQLSVLNAAFERSYFPSTEERLRLSKQTKMCPRTVQIWFQNKRQSVKARTEAMDVAVAAAGAGRRRGSQAQSRVREEAEERNLQKRTHESNANVTHSQQQQGEEQKQQHHSHHYHHQEQQHHHNHQQNQQYQQQQRHSPLGQAASRAGEKRRNSGPLTPSDSIVTSLQIQPDDRNADYFSRKRRATIAQMEQREF
ncbi:hypothetical protein BGX21_003321 [Mortierella sp. AD011]|nr:hypothetical protein BGX20_010919 [Mortierella sp. AD010]KAF9403505.1 hypothetical protein BGX21_003321 [Mortierella sp. AD011]